MNLDTLIKCRNKNNTIIQNLKDIIEIYNKRIKLVSQYSLHHTFYEKKELLFREFMDSIHFYQKILDEYIIYLDEINKIECSCCHRFIKDVIDIGPESTMNITYCEICEYTKP